jgi:hypothetical protein
MVVYASEHWCSISKCSRKINFKLLLLPILHVIWGKCSSQNVIPSMPSKWSNPLTSWYWIRLIQPREITEQTAKLCLVWHTLWPLCTLQLEECAQMILRSPLSFRLFFFFFSAGDWTQGLTHVRQAPYFWPILLVPWLSILTPSFDYSPWRPTNKENTTKLWGQRTKNSCLQAFCHSTCLARNL